MELLKDISKNLIIIFLYIRLGLYKGDYYYYLEL